MPGAAAQDMVNSYTSQYGVTDIPAMMLTAWDVAEQVKQICVPVVGLAMIFLMFRLVTSSFFQNTFDLQYALKFFGMVLCLVFYEDFLCALFGIVQYFTDSFSNISWGTAQSHLADSFANIVTNETKKANEEEGLFSAIKTAYEGFWASIVDTLVSSATGGIIFIVRALMYCIREIFLVFLIGTGPIAIVASLFPSFEGNFNMWLKYTMSVAFWSVTMGVLDMISFQFVENMQATGSNEGFIPLQFAIMFSYFMVPYMTSKIIHFGQSQFGRNMVGFAKGTINVGKKAASGDIAGAAKSVGAGAGKVANPSQNSEGSPPPGGGGGGSSSGVQVAGFKNNRAS